MTSKTFVLIPGAWLGAWAWNHVSRILRKQGHEVFPVTLTGMGDRVHLATRSHGMETAIQDVVNVIEFNDLKNIVLVGHSFAGKVAAAVADRVAGRIGSVIYLDSFLPKKIRTPQGGFQPDEFGKPAEGQWTIPFTPEIIDSIGPDVTGENRTLMLGRCTPWPLKLAEDTITLTERFDSIRCSYIFCSKGSDAEYLDSILNGDWGKLEGPHMVIDTGHWPMITKPEELSRMLIELSENQGS